MQYSKHAFYQDPMVFYARVNSSFTWNNNYDLLKGMHIGVTRGWSYGQRFDQNKPNLSLEPVGTVKANFQKLVTGRIDLLASHPRSAARVMEEMQIEDDIKMLLPPITINKGYFGFSRKKNLDDFIFRFDQEFEKMVESKEIIQLSKKYNLDYTNIHQ
ncbi:substrate-binding periplasmic protein [Vibrio algarum]|uniref:substrate-binding periplasmic protein n=1 Tax=Vibrio algarum TaxID=3020714 RepID=UPI0038999A73